MTVHSARMLVGFVANALLAFFVLWRDSKALANRLYSAFTFLIAWWALAKFASSYSASPEFRPSEAGAVGEARQPMDLTTVFGNSGLMCTSPSG